MLLAYNINPITPLSHPSGPLFDALLGTVCLWGARLSPDPMLSRHEEYLLSKSVQQLSSSIFNANNDTGPHGDAIVGVIQAEVLLANYYFAVGRFLEGRYRCSAAAALSVSCRLNVLSAPGQSSAHLLMSVNPSGAPFLGEAPPDAILVGERVNTFWAVYGLETSWSIALGSPSSMVEAPGATAMSITTPWPLGMAEYERVCFQHSVLPRLQSSDINVSIRVIK